VAEIKRPAPVRLVAGVIINPAEDADALKEALEDAWGRIDAESPAWPFDFTDYYEAEMGKGLLRKFFAWCELRDLDGLHRVKLESNAIEKRIAGMSSAGVVRGVNIDPGYICHSKLVLFTTKDFAHRVYISDGIFAEVTLEWRAGGFRPQPWTFPDYRSERYSAFLNEVRDAYAHKLKGGR